MPALFPSVRGLPRAFWFLWAGALLNRLGSFVGPFLAIYLTSSLGYSVEQAGLIVSCYGAGNFLASPVGGQLADAWGRRPAILLSLTAGPAALVALGFARAPLALAACAFLYGLLGDMYRSVNQAIVADLVPSEDRPRAYGALYWAANFGFAVALALAGWLAKRGFWLLFAGDAATTLGFAAVVWRRVPETRPAGTTVALGRAADWLAPLRDPPFLGFVLTLFLVASIFMQTISSFPMDVLAHGIPAEGYGTIMALNGVLIVLLMPTATALLPRFRQGRVLALAAALVGVGFGLNAFARSAPAYALALFVWTLGEICQSPIASTVAADLAPPERRGAYQGVFLMAWGAAAVLAPAGGAFVLGHYGSGALWGGCLGLGLAAAASHLALGTARERRLEAPAVAVG